MAHIDGTLKNYERAYADAMFAVRDLEMENLRRAIRRGTATPARVISGSGGIFRHGNDLAERLRRLLSEVRDFGGAQVRDELERQA